MAALGISTFLWSAIEAMRIASIDKSYEGEKRRSLHVAVDRFTGEVIDQQLEAVYE
jgi:hypothetical protein